MISRPVALFTSVALAAALPAQAAERQLQAAPQLFSAGYIAQVLGSLLLVFVCLFGLIYLLRRMNRFTGDGTQPVRVLGSASVGAREKAVLVSVGGQQLLLGVAPGSVRTLHAFATPVVEERANGGAAGARDFASILRAANPLGASR